MGQLFNYWHSARHHGIDAMGRILLLAFLVSGIVYGQSQPSSEKIKKDVYSVQSAVDDAVGAAIPGWGVLQKARGAYLEGYGIVVTMEVALDSPLTPFSGQKTPEEVRVTATQRRKEVEEKVTNILKQKAPALESIAPAESVAIILNILNTNPAYVPDLPSQIILSVKKQDAAHVTVRVY